MVYMIEKIFRNTDMGIELTSFIDNKQNFWFKGKDVAHMLGYSDTNQAIRKHVSKNRKIKHIFRQPVETAGWSQTYLIDKAGFYELVFSSKLETAKSSLIGYLPLYSHQSVNMANTNCLIVPGIR